MNDGLVTGWQVVKYSLVIPPVLDLLDSTEGGRKVTRGFAILLPVLERERNENDWEKEGEDEKIVLPPQKKKASAAWNDNEFRMSSEDRVTHDTDM